MKTNHRQVYSYMKQFMKKNINEGIKALKAEYTNETISRLNLSKFDFLVLIVVNYMHLFMMLLFLIISVDKMMDVNYVLLEIGMP